MQYYFYFYSSISAVALLVHLIINWRQLANWRVARSRAGSLEFRQFLAIMTAFFALDVMWGFFAEWRCHRVLYIDTVLFFLALVGTAYAWLRFVVAYLKIEGLQCRCLQWGGRVMLVFFIAALALNHFTGSFFKIAGPNMYEGGRLRALSLMLLIAINLFSSWLTLYNMLHIKGNLHRRNTMVFVFGVTMIAAVLLQLWNPLLPFYSLGFLLGSCLLHVFVVEAERAKIQEKERLVHDYEVQLESERMLNQAKSLFFSTVSHDIRTPLNAIIGFSQLLEQGVSDEDERGRYISSICSSGRVLSRLVDDILDLSKMECGKMDVINEPTDVPKLVREVMAACEVARARKSLTLLSEIDEMPWVSVDPQRIRQILFNLLSNAYKYTDRGTVSVSVRWRDGTLSLSVADTGKGISKENLVMILQPFVQVADKNHRDGTGLGLPICNKLAKLMGGELTVKSEVGVGSTFTITLHNVQAVAAPVKRSERHQDAAVNTGRLPSKILVVDDSGVNRAVLKALLAKCGVANVVMANNGIEALKALECEPDIDMVLSDLWMPEMDGRGLVKAIRADARFAHLPVHLVTADVEARAQSESDGFTGILLKPISLDGLQSLLTTKTK